MGKMTKTENPEIAKGLKKFGPGKELHNSGKWRFMTAQAKAGHKKKEVKPEAVGKWYGTKAEKCSKKTGSVTRKAKNLPKLKKGLETGRVVIILAGRFQGKRAVFIKQLPSGLILISGPYEANGVPLRRIAQSYVIVTSTKLDVSGNFDEISDEYFSRKLSSSKEKKLKAMRWSNNEDKFFKQGQKPEVDEQTLAKRKETQKKVDAAIMKAVSGTPLMKEYLGTSFALMKNDAPHKMVF